MEKTLSTDVIDVKTAKISDSFPVSSLKSSKKQNFHKDLNQMKDKSKEKKKKRKEVQGSASIKERVNSLYDLMQGESLDELEIKEDNFYLYIKRKSKTAPSTSHKMTSNEQNKIQIENLNQATNTESNLTVKSPIIGVFYRAPSPSSQPFVKEGDVVQSGKTLCIIEAMKVMNEIKADYKMKISKILIENGKNVTAGQDIFVIEKV